MDLSDNCERLILCQSGGGVELRGTLARLSRHAATFEVYSPLLGLQVSEALPQFEIIIGGRRLYSGRATVTGLVHMTTMVLCEVALNDGWADVDFGPMSQTGWLQREFSAFMAHWQKQYRIRSEMKLVVADIQSYLDDLRRWLEQLELGIRSCPSSDRIKLEREVVSELESIATPALHAFFLKFEEVAHGIEEEMQPAHRSYCRRQLHPFLLCSPFMHRIYVKPLGYAGDYEMINMILRDPNEGSSLLAKLLNVYILRQTPAVAHRNRIDYLITKLTEETSRALRNGKRLRVFNVGCGPAREVQRFLEEVEVSRHADFTMLDMNDETLMHASQALERAKTASGRAASFKLVKNSVHQLIKQANKPAGQPEFDFIYCAGLFDYVSDRVCKSLMTYFYNLLAPGGLVLVTNVDSANPIRNIMEYIFEWHLIYRNGKQLAALVPSELAQESVSVRAETSSNNLFLELRKSS